MTTLEGYIGIDNGTQGLSVIFTDTNLKVLACAEGSYAFVEGLPEGCYEQRVEDWDAALISAMAQIHRQLGSIKVLGIGISGQMHGEVLADETGKVLQPVRLWCDSRNEAEGHELTDAFQFKVAKRATAARFLWTARNRPETAAKVRHMTTPAGWIAYRLTGEWNLGIGDAAGMFPIDQATLDYDKSMLQKFDKIVGNKSIPSLASILPKVKKAGENAGSLNDSGARMLNLPPGIPVAAGEGDQVASLAGSLIGTAGMVSCSFGTSVCANIVGDHAFQGVSPAVDLFCAADGKPILMVWLRNGTTFLNSIVGTMGQNKDDAFKTVMPQVIAAPPDCGGLIALPFMDDEPGLGVSQGRTALIMGWNADNAKPGNVAKAALLSTMFNLRLGCEVLDEQKFARTELCLSGGLVKTPECGQILADVFDSRVTLLESAEEGCSWGAAVLAKYRVRREGDWPTFLKSLANERPHRRFEPNVAAVPEYERVFQRYKKLVKLERQLSEVLI